MTKPLVFLRVGLCACLCFLLVVAVVGFGIVSVSDHVVTDPNNAKKAIAALNLFPAVSSQLESYVDSQIPFPLRQTVGPNFSSELVSASVDQAWFDSQVNGLVDNVFGFLNGNASTLSLSVSLASPKQRAEFFLDQRFSGPLGSSVAEYVDFSLVPDSIDVLQQIPPSQRETMMASLSQGRDVLNQLPVLSLLFGLIAIVFSVLLVLILRNRFVFLCLGVSFLVAGLVLGGLGAVVSVESQSLGASFLSQFSAAKSVVSSASLVSAVTVYVSAWTTGINQWAMVFFGLAVVFLAVFGYLMFLRPAKVASKPPVSAPVVSQDLPVGVD